MSIWCKSSVAGSCTQAHRYTDSCRNATKRAHESQNKVLQVTVTCCHRLTSPLDIVLRPPDILKLKQTNCSQDVGCSLYLSKTEVLYVYFRTSSYKRTCEEMMWLFQFETWTTKSICIVWVSWVLFSLLTNSLWVTGRMVRVSSVLGGLPRSWLWLCDGRGGGLSSSLRTWRSPFAADPALSLRTGLVSHFFRVLTDRLEPGELGAELPEACGGSDATEVEMLPSLPAAEYESGQKIQIEK